VRWRNFEVVVFPGHRRASAMVAGKKERIGRMLGYALTFLVVAIVAATRRLRPLRWRESPRSSFLSSSALSGDAGHACRPKSLKALENASSIQMRSKSIAVRSEDEKRTVAEMASAVAGANKVTNELTAQPAKQ
jgi:hypothetical protein